MADARFTVPRVSRGLAPILLSVVSLGACGDDSHTEPHEDPPYEDGGTTSISICPDAECGTVMHTLAGERGWRSGVAALYQQQELAIENACFGLANKTGADFQDGETAEDLLRRTCHDGVSALLGELAATTGGTAYGAARCSVSLDDLDVCVSGCSCDETCDDVPFPPATGEALAFARCDGECTGTCLPHAEVETIACSGMCLGRCSGTCEGIEGAVAGFACDGVCDGLCDGPCEGEAPAACGGWCEGTCDVEPTDRHQAPLPAADTCPACAARCADFSALAEQCTRVGVSAPGLPSERERLAHAFLQACAEAQAPEITRYIAALPARPLDVGPSPTEEDTACAEAAAVEDRLLLEVVPVVAASCADAPLLVEALTR